LFPGWSKNLASNTLERLLDRLDEAKSSFGRLNSKAVHQILKSLQRRRFDDAESLIRYHELLLFLRAYPSSASNLQLAERELASLPQRLNQLELKGTDLSAFEDPEVSGIAGTSVTDTFSYFIVKWLRACHHSEIEFDWDWFESENRLAETWPRFMPLLDEDAYVEANVPYREWLRAARGREREVAWLLRQFDSLEVSEREKAELYDSQQLYVRWTPSYATSRTGMRLPIRQVFYHRDALIHRRDISFANEIQKPPPSLVRLDPKYGERILDMARETSTLRYRELYGFTHGDPKRVLHAHLGRGVDLFVTGVPAGKRLPLRAYHAAMIFKNGVPVGYFEGLSLFERMESGFNFYYGFREGETAWIYARTLNVFRHLLGVTTFSIDPYQVGHENEEGIESGAFWFYRKLGFRPTRRDLLQLTEQEEKKIAARSVYRTPAHVLRELASGPMILELDQSHSGDWDRFQLRNIGFSIQRKMAKLHSGDARQFRGRSLKALAESLGLDASNQSDVERQTLSDFAVVLSLTSDLRQWSREERQLLVRVIQVRCGSDESRYLKLMQKHMRLRDAIITAGSKDL
jgi:hypothetical protein